jgi:hypothetical protein
VAEVGSSPHMERVIECLAQTSGVVVLPTFGTNVIHFEVEAWRISSTARSPANDRRRGIRPQAGVTGTVEFSDSSSEDQLLVSVVAHGDVGSHAALDTWLTLHAPSMEPAVAGALQNVFCVSAWHSRRGYRGPKERFVDARKGG